MIHSIVKRKTKGIYGRPRFRPLIHTVHLFSTYSYIVYWWWYCTVLYSHHLWSPLSSYWPYKKVENFSLFFYVYSLSSVITIRNLEMMLEVVRLTYFPWQKKQHPADNNHFVKKKKREFEKVNDEETRKQPNNNKNKREKKTDKKLLLIPLATVLVSRLISGWPNDSF